MTVIEHKKNSIPALSRHRTYCAQCGKPLNMFLARRHIRTPKIKCLNCAPPKTENQGLSAEDLRSLFSVLR